MVKIKNVSHDARKLITRLVTLLEGNGGFVHPYLQVSVAGGEFSMLVRRGLALNESVITVPLSCMPVLNDFDYSLKQGILVAQPKALYAISEVHREAMAISVALYNLFDKVEAYSRVSPVTRLRECEALYPTLLGAAQAQFFLAPFSNKLDDLKVFAFWHNRSFHDAQTGTDRLLTFLEFFDHHSLAHGYTASGSADVGDRSLFLRYTPIDHAKRVYVYYSPMDALECFVKYGFVDTSSCFVKSQPFSIELPEVGEVRVAALEIKSNQLPTSRWLWPATDRFALDYCACVTDDSGAAMNSPSASANAPVGSSENEKISKSVFAAAAKPAPPCIHFATIPHKRHINAHNEALRHQMAILEKYCALGEGTLNNQAILATFKRALVDENRRFYQHLLLLAKQASLDKRERVTAMLAQVLNRQLNIISAYEQHLV